MLDLFQYTAGIFAEQHVYCAATKSVRRLRCRNGSSQGGQAMKVFWGLGKILVLGFWLVVLANALFEAPSPFGVMIDMAGAVLLLTHLLELILFNGSLRGRRHPWRDRGKIILFGIFHLQSISRSASGHSHA
ncbi:Membrane protein [Pseudomonas syringae pv. coriandricola]|uniref:Membrane protein n=2 Tax=Pseudomonas TaxID=286 RepID=A0A0P9NZG6_9PSED|nr:Membrane protein [Pseudomonas syringae pv. coriandricola]RMN15332.1 Membrane protein [Pseudomonas syringae pv. coriandricola]